MHKTTGTTLMMLVTVSQLFTACSLKEGQTFEDIYTDVKVVKPTSNHYNTKNTHKKSTPILSEKREQKKSSYEQSTQRIKETGHIISSLYDGDVDLYMYTLSPESGGDQILFFSDKHIDISKHGLVDVDIKDNYLYTITAHQNTFTTQSPSTKVKYIKHIKQNKKIPAAFEERIDTF